MRAVAVPVPMSLPMPMLDRPMLDGPTERLVLARAASRPRRTGWGIAVDYVGRVGSLVTLAAALVVAGAVGGLADGVPPTGSAGATAHATPGSP